MTKIRGGTNSSSTRLPFSVALWLIILRVWWNRGFILSNAVKMLHGVSALYASHLNAEITIFVLLTGILVGLALVVVVLCACKCCLKPSKPLKRQQVVFTKYSSEREESTWNGHESGSGWYQAFEISERCPTPSSLQKLPVVDVEKGGDDDDDITHALAARTSKEDNGPLLEEITTHHPPSPSDNRVFPQCSRESSHHRLTPEVRPTGHTSLLPRTLNRAGFPYSPPIQRQSSICLQTSNEQLDRYTEEEEEETGAGLGRRRWRTDGGGDDAAASLASPEGSSSMDDEATTATRGVAQMETTTTCVSAEVHQAPRPPPPNSAAAAAAQGGGRRQRHHRHLSPAAAIDSAALFPHCIVKASTAAVSSISLDSQPEQQQQQQRHLTAATSPLSSESDRSAVLPRPASALDMRSAAAADWLDASPEIQHAASTEDSMLESMMERRCRENIRLLFVGQKGVHSLVDDDDEPRSKVRYNDTGSREEVNEDVLDMFTEDTFALITPDVMDIREQQQQEEDEQRRQALLRGQYAMAAASVNREANEALALQSRKLWELRATFEEEDDEAPFQPDEPNSVNNHHDGDDSNGCGEDVKPGTHAEIGQGGEDCDLAPLSQQTTAATVTTTDCVQHLVLPTYESKRQSYKNILSKRVKKLESGAEQTAGGGSGSVDNSFDSVETEGSSTDASRLEAVTTSMESTTDNTDSTGEGQINRLQQMKHDSGYKSLEANGTKTVRKQIHFAVDDDSVIEVVGLDDGDGRSAQPPPTVITLGLPPVRTRQGGSRIVRGGVQDGGSGKTASKKRREYTRERQAVESSFGSELDTTVLGQGGIMADDGQGKTSVFSRFFRQSREEQQQQQQQQPPLPPPPLPPTCRSARTFNRDFSIDEKSDALFHEFSRRDPVLEMSSRCRSPRLHARHRLYHHRHLDSDSGTGSPRHATRSKLSPQDSIEEERRSMSAEDGGSSVAVVHHSIAEIPIIKVADENSS